MGDLRARAKAAINSFIATPLDFTTRVNGALGFKKPGQNHKVGKMKAKSQLDFTTRVKKHQCPFSYLVIWLPIFFFVTFKYTSIVLGSMAIIDIHTGTAEIYFTGYPITSLIEPNLCNGTL